MYIRKVTILLIFINLGLLIFQLGPNNFEKYMLKRHIKNVISTCNNYSWINYSGKEGIDFFSKDMQAKLFLNDLDYNVQFVRDYKIESKSYIDRINDIKIVGNKAQVSLISRNIITDIEGTTDYKTAMVVCLYKENNKWIIDNIIFDKKGA